MFSLYPCNATAIQGNQVEIVLTEFKINAYTHDKEFDPIVMYFYKGCDSNAPAGKDFVLLAWPAM